MDMLEARFYSREEIGAILNLNIHDNNFAATAKALLKKWDYQYEFIPRRGFEITKTPLPAEVELKELLINGLKVDTQVNPYHFACFVSALLMDELFDAMPWAERVKYMDENFGISVSDKTLQSWRDYLCDAGTATQFPKGALWHTHMEGGSKIREQADPKSPEYKSYCVYRRELLNQGLAWGQMVNTLYKKYGVYYYCKSINLNRIGKQFEKIRDLTERIMLHKEEKTG